MALRASIFAAAALATTLVAGAANAAQTSGAVNLRTGPGVSYNKLTTIPAYANINVYSCDYSWCQVSWQGWQGWISARYVASDVRYTTPRYVAPVAHPYVAPVAQPYIAPVVVPYIGFNFGFTAF